MRAPSIKALSQALEARDPELSSLVIALAKAPLTREEPPAREGALTYERFCAELRSEAFRVRPAAERNAWRRAQLAALEAADAEVPLPERLRLHEILLALWQDGGIYARIELLHLVAEIPICWGPWRAMKRIFKEAEEHGDLEMLGALAARFDTALANREPTGEVSRRTLAFLVRRAWRFLRRTAETLGASYADAAVQVLRFYPEGVSWRFTWIANHIFYHETGDYKAGRFRFTRRPSTLLKYRYAPELWRRTPRPLFFLLERARSDRARRFAADALKSDFRAALREVEPAWVARLAGLGSVTADDFVVWLLGNVPRFEQGSFRALGLHEPVLTLLDSPSRGARDYAAGYARAHARDLGLEELLRLANNDHKAVRELARDLLHDRDPRKDIGLEAWGRLLGTPHAHELATAAIRRHFGARELDRAWFHERLLAKREEVFRFAADLLGKVHPKKELREDFYVALLDDPRLHSKAARFALAALAQLDLSALDEDFLRRSLLHPKTAWQLAAWIDEGRLEAKRLGTDFLKSLAFHPDWEASSWVRELRAVQDRPWTRELEYDADLGERALGWLGDVRFFSSEDLGFEWLMRLVERSEPQYHDFGVEYMIKAFLPADFAPAEKDEAKDSAAQTDLPAGEIAVDLGGETFLFTGKLATMSRGEAKKKVTAAGGKNASGVTKSLDYLVIGDEGSPLYGEGRKGSKQVKAEKLIEEGAALRVISETAFLKRLAGEERELSADAVAAGCERLWAHATGPGPADAPLARFARRYIERHHPDIAVVRTDRHVDPGTEIPEDFLTFERVDPLFDDPRRPVRELALELARWEFARWDPPAPSLVRLAESSHPEVRAFVSEALLAADTKEHRRYRIDSARLTPEAVYRFCESQSSAARDLGMQLIAREARLAVPEELFRLTESPDRNVRAFVVRTLWSLYRDRGITPHYRPSPPPESVLARKRPAQKDEAKEEAASAGPPPRPEAPPASPEDLRDFLRRVLFAVPPARLPKKSVGTLRPLPARKAKRALVEALRDLAAADAAFAAVLLPVLREFMPTRGASERAACLVALTRIEHRHPELRAAGSSPKT